MALRVPQRATLGSPHVLGTYGTDRPPLCETIAVLLTPIPEAWLSPTPLGARSCGTIVHARSCGITAGNTHRGNVFGGVDPARHRKCYKPRRGMIPRK